MKKVEAAGQRVDYVTGCLLDCKYIKYLYRLMAVDLSRQKELDAAPKAVYEIEIVGQLKKQIAMVMLQTQAITNPCLL